MRLFTKIIMIFAIPSFLVLWYSCDKDGYKEPEDEPKYRVRVNIIPEESGEISGAGNYHANSNVSLTAAALTGYEFSFWQHSGEVITGTSYEFKMPYKDVEILAVFTEIDAGEDGPGTGIVDIENNHYPTRIIGGREWMTTNLRTTYFNDGSEVPYTTDSLAWQETNTAAFTWYNNDYDEYNDTYGVLYNWHAVKSNKICPTGWEVPTDNDWKLLEAIFDTEYFVSSFEWDKYGWRGYDAGSSLAFNENLWEDGQLKFYHQFSQNSYFNAIPAGQRNSDGTFSNIGEATAWWTITLDEGLPLIRKIQKDNLKIYRNPQNENIGYSVRCIKSIK